MFWGKWCYVFPKEDDCSDADIIRMYQNLPEDDPWGDALMNEVVSYLLSCRLVRIPPEWQHVFPGAWAQRQP